MDMYYTVTHKTRFHYSQPISESFMEVHMQPRGDGGQRCLAFELDVQPRARIFAYRDYHGNWVNYFDIPQFHSTLTITATSTVQVGTAYLGDGPLPASAWADLDAQTGDGDFWEMLSPTALTQPTPLLHTLAAELGMDQRRADPLSLLTEMTAALYDAFAYAPDTTRVDSPIDEALAARHGVCQDFAHIMIALVRGLCIPCRYVSGYIIPNEAHSDRSPEHASHAWVEAYLPGLEWISFDPTNNLIGHDRHIRVAVGRDYADIAPSRGMFKGEAETELQVGVQVRPVDAEPEEDDLLPEMYWDDPPPRDPYIDQIQQQQQ